MRFALGRHRTTLPPLLMSSIIDIHLKALNFHRSFVGSVPPGAGAAPSAAPPAKAAAQKAPSPATAKAPAEDNNDDKLVLDNATFGQVMTRFPPEASGYLHIGHAKAALVNSMLRTKYGGKMLFRFDDTNPGKEKHEYEKAIIDDLGKLGIQWDIGPTYSSSYFDVMIEKATELIKRGLAYCDNTPVEEMRANRFAGIESKNRNLPVEENLRIWDEMLRGTALGQQYCLRAKISIDEENKAMRDPTIYRVNLLPHPRTGSKFKAYPTYDFCCPIMDSVEGVTHALRTNEYHDRNDQYYWFIDALNLRRPELQDFSRLNMEYSLMSKRKLTKLVDEKVVDGWDDPRFPTVRALLRRGMKLEALQEFIKVQGMSKAVNFMEWHKLWSFNVQVLDPIAPRYSAVSAEQTTVCTVMGGPAGLEPFEKPRHKKNPTLGNKTVFRSSQILMDAEDIALLRDGEEVTLMDWGNAFIHNIELDTTTKLPVKCTATLHLEGDFKKTKYKLHWIALSPKNVSLVLHEYDNLLTKKKPDPDDDIDKLLSPVSHYAMRAIGEEAMAELRKGDSFQIERRGYYIIDRIDDDRTMQLIYTPDAKEKVSHLSAKAQYLKLRPVVEAKSSPTAQLSLEARRAEKAAKKAASKQR